MISRPEIYCLIILPIVLMLFGMVWWYAILMTVGGLVYGREEQNSHEFEKSLLYGDRFNDEQ